MDRLEKLYSKASDCIRQKKEEQKRKVFEKMSISQLEELARDDLPTERMKEILASAGGLWLLEGGV